MAGPKQPSVSPRRRGMSVVLVFVLFGAGPARIAAQGDFMGIGSVPPWANMWSPLTPIAELPRQSLLEMLAVPSLLTRPSPRIGLFWTAGNPGALASEVLDEHAEFEVTTDRLSGSYHRPLDPGAVSRSRGSGRAWGRLGERGAGIGRVVVHRANFDEGVFADVLQPYATEPYAILDTLGEATSGTAVLLEGTGGWSLGRVAFGIGLGYTSREVRTVASAVPRIHTIATPGLTAGINYDLVAGKLRLGVFTRWQQSAESSWIYSVAAASRVYELAGYREPVTTDLTSSQFNHRFERRAWAQGVTAGGVTNGISWNLFAQRERNSASNFNTTYGDSDEDRWDADGWTGGASAQARLWDDRVLVTVGSRFTTLSGVAEHHDVEGVPFAAHESRLSIATEARLLPGSQWEAALSTGVNREDRRRSDGLAEVFTDLCTWHPMAALEVARWFGTKLALAVGGAVAEHNPSGSLPLAAAMGPAYGNWIAPELALEATEAHGKAGTLTLRWQARATTAFWIQGRYATVSPSERGPGSLQHRPDGDRNGWSLTVAVLLGIR